MSKAVKLILDSELASELEITRGLSALVDKVVTDRMLSRYQYLDALVEIASCIAKLRVVSADEIFKELAKVPRSGLLRSIDELLDSPLKSNNLKSPNNPSSSKSVRDLKKSVGIRDVA